MQTFEQALFQLYAGGRITLEEAMANSDSPTNLHWLVSNASKSQTNAAAAAGSAAQAPDPKTQTAPGDLSTIKLDLDALG